MDYNEDGNNTFRSKLSIVVNMCMVLGLSILFLILIVPLITYSPVLTSATASAATYVDGDLL